MTNWKTGLNKECKTFTSMIHIPEQSSAFFWGYGSLSSSLGGTALSPLIATTLQKSSCRKQANNKKHFGTIFPYQQEVTAQSDPLPTRQNPALQHQWEGILQTLTGKSFIKIKDSAKKTHTNETKGIPSQVKLKTTSCSPCPDCRKPKDFSNDWETH